MFITLFDGSFKFHCQVFVNVVHVGVGPISQSDVDLAQACGACIVGFNVKTPPSSISVAATRASIKVLDACYFQFSFLVCMLYSLL